MPELYGDFHISTVRASDSISAKLLSNIPLGHSASHMGRTMERYAQRSELMAKKRKLQSDLQTQQEQVTHTAAELATIESELASFESPGNFPHSSPGGLPHSSPAKKIGVGQDVSDMHVGLF